jgi:nitrogen fixation NifU-like protein
MIYRSRTAESGGTSYSAKVIAESSHPSNMGRMSDPDAHGIIRGCCGDTMEFFLRLQGDTIEGVTFVTDGRESAIACASMLCKTVQGMSLEEAGSIQPEGLVAALGGLPKAKEHCAKLTVKTLREAIANGRG